MDSKTLNAEEISAGNADMDMFFYRDAKQNEIDLVLRSFSVETAVEIKSASGFSPSMLKGLNFVYSYSEHDFTTY